MVAVMILHVRSKYTAVGRKEIVTFFYMYFVVELLSIFMDSGIIPSSSSVYPVSWNPLRVLDPMELTTRARSGSLRSTWDSSVPRTGAYSSMDSWDSSLQRTEHPFLSG